jgi:hypothetical protein
LPTIIRGIVTGTVDVAKKKVEEDLLPVVKSMANEVVKKTYNITGGRKEM